VAMLATSAGGLFVSPEVTRNLPFIIPAGILIMVGFDFLVGLMPWRALRSTAYATLFAAFAGYGLFLTWDNIKHGDTATHNYTLFGLQWGAKQVVRDAIPAYLREHPDEVVFLATEWSNSPDYILDFFNSPPNFRL